MSGFQNDPGTVQQEAGFGFNGRFWTESFADGLTARAGGGQANATQLTSMINTVSTVATAGDSVQLPPAQPGLSICVANTSAIALQCFAQNGSTDTINTVAGSTGVSQMANSVVWYSCTKAGVWTAQGLGTGNYTVSGLANLNTYSTQTGVTAHAGGGQGSATQLTAGQVQISVCATIGDSVKLPPSQPGAEIVVVNNGAASANAFPTAGESMNGTLNASSAVAAGTITLFFCFVTGNWVTK